MMVTKRIRHFPIIEATTFCALTLAAVVLIYNSSASLFLLIAIAPFVYIITMGRATIVTLAEHQLNVKSLSIFMKSRDLNLNYALKIILHQTFHHETDITFGGSFFSFDKYYELQFKNPDGSLSSIFFSINNKVNEEKIIKAISSYISQSEIM
jgi:hypothetical protein